MSTLPHATDAAPLPKGQAGPCSHPLAPSLSSELANTKICPPCTIQGYIDTVRNIQRDLEARGGIFVSRPRSKKDFDHPEWQLHLGIREQWRQAKIASLNDVMKFEILAKREPKEEGWHVLDEALELWDKEVESLGEVPGYPKEMSEEEVGDIVKRMMNQLRQHLNSALEDVDMTDAGGNSAETETEEEEEEATSCPFPDSDVDTDSEDDDVSDPGFAPEDQSSNDTDQESEDEALSPELAPDDVDTVMEDADDSTTQMNGEGKSRRRVRFTDFATVSPDSLTFVPSLFPHTINLPSFNPVDSGFNFNISTALLSNTTLSSTPTLQPHRRRVDVSQKRRKRQFARSRDGYHAGKWASPVGYEKPDTSGYSMEWEDVEMWRLADEQEEVLEKKAFDSVLAVAGTWVLGRVLKGGLWSYGEVLKKITEENVGDNASVGTGDASE